MKHIVILGAGSAGVMFANRLRREVSESEVEITIIERKEMHFYQPAYTLIVFGLEEPENLMRPTKDLFYDGINLIIDEATKIDAEKSTISTAKNGDISYDYLVIATGAKFNFDEPEGMKEGLEKAENVHTFYTFEGALKLREALNNFEGGTIISSVAEMPIKCPAAPMKFIMMAEDMMREKGIRNKCKFIFTITLPAVFSREPYVGKLNSLFKAKGIEAIPNFAPSQVDYNNGVLKDYSGKELKFDLLSIVPPHEGDQVVENAEGVGNPAGYVACDKNHMYSLNYKNIYSIGDATDFPTSKTASGARKQAKVLVDRVKSILKGEEPKATYDGEIICPMLTRNKRVLFAHFNYTESLSPAIESYMNWVLKVHMLRPMYWNLMLKGLM